MRLLSILVALMAAAALAVGQQAGAGAIIGMGVIGLLLAAVTFRSPSLPFFLRIFSSVFAIEYVVFGAASLLAQLGWWPPELRIPVVPTSLPTTVGVFGILMRDGVDLDQFLIAPGQRRARRDRRLCAI